MIRLSLSNSGKPPQSENKDEKRTNKASNYTPCAVDAGAAAGNDGPAASPSMPSRIKKIPLTTRTSDRANPLKTILRTLARIVFLDSLMALIFATYLFLVWTRHVHDAYLTLELEAAEWNWGRSIDEMTYYQRACHVEDMTATEGHELFLSESATPEEAYQHQLRHGFTVFPGVLSDDTATNLRNYIVSRNQNLPESEKIFVISIKNRYSFGLGTEEPSVTKAMMELTSNTRLKESVEKILGKNPALIEMTAITSTYGAADQHWHDDVVAVASAVQYGRTFGPSYSLFIQLQNTTKEMGATAVCPGTYMCSAGSMKSYCKKHGFQLTNEQGFWGAGDALLMNMNSFHRGAAHIDPNAPDRVMFILTFVPKPRPRAESRMLSQGITFSLRWDMWGHTWQDMMHAETAMWRPLATLRALGLYKSPGAEWGVDYVSSVVNRMANEDNGFKEIELKRWINFGGFSFLPSWLEGNVDTDEYSWHDYLLSTLEKCTTFIMAISVLSTACYLFFLSIGSNEPYERRRQCFRWALFRVVVIHGFVFLLYKVGVSHVDKSGWASDIRAGLRYTNPFVNEVSRYFGPVTFPNRRDVLIETRYKSEYLAVYNDYVGNHPANRLWIKLVKAGVPSFTSYSMLPSVFRDAVAAYIVGAIHDQAGRFLYQNQYSDWVLLSVTDSVVETKYQLHLKSHPFLEKLIIELEYLVSEVKYGYLRMTSMNRNDISAFLQQLKHRLLEGACQETKQATSAAHQHRRSSHQHSILFGPLPLVSVPKSNAKPLHRLMNLHVGVLPDEPTEGAWMAVGDIVEVIDVDDESGKAYWYPAELTHVSSSNYFSVVNFGNGNEDIVTNTGVRWYEPPIEGDKVQVKLDGQYHDGIVDSVNNDGTFNVEIDGQVYEDLDDGDFRFYEKQGYEPFRSYDEFE